MSFEYIRDYYGVPAEVGRRVRVGGKEPREGVITGSHNQYIIIHLDGDKKSAGCYHPTSEIEYLGMGTVPKMTRSQKRYARYKSMADLFDDFRQFLGYESQERDARRLGFSSVSDYSAWLRTIP